MSSAELERAAYLAQLVNQTDAAYSFAMNLPLDVAQSLVLGPLLEMDCAHKVEISIVCSRQSISLALPTSGRIMSCGRVRIGPASELLSWQEESSPGAHSIKLHRPRGALPELARPLSIPTRAGHVEWTRPWTRWSPLGAKESRRPHRPSSWAINFGSLQRENAPARAIINQPTCSSCCCCCLLSRHRHRHRPAGARPIL